MLASFLIPTRKRPEGLAKAIQSIVGNAADPSRAEILLYVDDDDTLTNTALKKPPLSDLIAKYNVVVVHGPRPAGAYGEIHKCYNALFEKSTGEFCVSFNDDCIITSRHWDRILGEYTGKHCILRAYSSYIDGSRKRQYLVTSNPFPIVARSISECLGQFGWHPSLDAIYEQHMGQDYYYIEDRITIDHGMGFESEHIKDGIHTTPTSWNRHQGRISDEKRKIAEWIENERLTQ